MEKMKIKLKLPKISMTMTEATLVKWHKYPGDVFNDNEILYEIETEKIIDQIIANFSGIMLQHLCNEDHEINVGEEVCIVQKNT